MPELKIYTVKDLREWLENNRPAEGLSERVIAPTRAWAIIHNPYVKDEDAIVAAIFEDGELAAYTASFPDMLDGKRVWWASTLYCYPKFTGKGYGLIVVGSLIEEHEPDLTYDRWGGNATVEICNHLGLVTTYTPRYYLKEKIINTSTLKGKLAAFLYSIQKSLYSKKASNADYTVQYASSIDDEAYAFMKTHKGTDLWLREQEMLNWILEYPFVSGVEGNVYGVRDKECYFSSKARVYEYKLAKVYVEEQLQGVYVLRQHDDELSVVYLYYAQEQRDMIFDSIVDYVITNKPLCVSIESKELRDYIQDKLHFPKMNEEQISFSLPKEVTIPETYSLQYGDGDSFM